jgi:hypothetical protein
MRIVIPLGSELRFEFGHSLEEGWYAMGWRKPTPLDGSYHLDAVHIGRADDGLSGVREPRKPTPSPEARHVALPRPPEDDFR